jgi:lysophospholipase L1-like esterase
MKALQPGTRIVTIGDSITDAGRNQPVGTAGSGLGSGYVALLNAFALARKPELGLVFLNTGTSGHTVRDLADRWQRDVFDLNPDVVTVMIGTNDVWRQFDSPLFPAGHVLPDEYESTLRELTKQTTERGIEMLLATPFYLEPNPADAMRARMDEYGAMVKAISTEFGTDFLDTQALFTNFLEHYYPAAMCWDRVHPNLAGSVMLAEGFAGVLGFGGSF